MKETVLLIDGDILAFRMSAAADERNILVKHNPTGKVKVFKHRTELKKRLTEKGVIDQLNDYTVEDQVIPGEISYCMFNIKNRIKKLKEFTEADRTEIYISGDVNFRKDLALPTRYKAVRDDLYRPTFLDDSKEYLTKYHGAVKAWEIEADDILSVRAYEEIDKGNRAIIASVDKDTFQAERVGFLDWTQENMETFWIPNNPAGDIAHNGKKVVGHGYKFLAYQWLVGDKVDGYKPTELSKLSYGDKTAVAHLAPLKTQEEISNFIVQKYKEFYPEPFTYIAWNGQEIEATWETMADLYFKCAWMKRSWDDQSDFKELLRSRGWNGK